ncbi:DUF4998 domain-containing protein [Haoranjiania flava]|uniref:DUF4998 domain-containing protein n=1 Tax=Haoranjiania flava TaxID=1856322 RepID=A0AAE3INS0_9BACT|nr:DUF4998 domain-containing protein [Haoranjiania flava]MCU7693661.1 DUF4998 domain-containing protein [Haoranjiania flava]
MKKIFKKIGLLTLVAMLAIACSKMDATYRQFIESGQLKYAGKADSVQVLSGRNRMMLTWRASADPKVNRAVIYWNNRADSVEIQINPEEKFISVPFNDMAEGKYVFEIITYDNVGNRSLKVEKVGKVYGDKYQASLLPRPIESTVFLTDTLQVKWGSAPDTSIVRTELIYKDARNVEHTIHITRQETVSFLMNFTGGTLQYRTLYLPDRLAIDTFYTPFESRRIKGAPIELSKQGWTATASSYDIAGNRPPSNAIDDKPSTIWVNQTKDPAYVYPHTITVDMGVVKEELEGFAIITRVGDASARPRTIELYTSEDGNEWVKHLTYVLENTGDKQFINLSAPVKARYFRMIGKDAFSGSNIALAEIGMFTR